MRLPVTPFFKLGRVLFSFTPVNEPIGEIDQWDKDRLRFLSKNVA